MEERKMFRGDRAFLSNMYAASIKIDNLLIDEMLTSLTFPTSEHAYQWHKKEDRLTDKWWISKCTDPNVTGGQIKRLSRTIQIRWDWRNVSLDVMRMVCNLKFKQHPELLNLLKSIEDEEIIEWNTWKDTYWGKDISTGYGKNHLGKILTEIRDHEKNTPINHPGSQGPLGRHEFEW